MKYGISYLTVMGARFSTSSSAISDEWVEVKVVCVKLNRTVLDARKTEMRPHQVLAAPTQLFYLPHKSRFIRSVLDVSG